MKFATYKNWKIANKIKTCLKGAAFWVSGQQSSCAENPSLPILAAITLENELQEIGHVSTEVKSFWSKTTDQDQLTATFNQLKRLNKLDVIWKLCIDERNSLAIKIIKSNDNEALYSSWAGANHIDEYTWASEEEIISIAEKLALGGSFFNNESSMEDDPITYQDVYKIFYSLGNTKICAFIANEINKIKTEEWLTCIAENGAALYLVKDKNHHFSDAIKDFLVSVVSGADTSEVNSDLMKNIPSLLAKTADLEIAIIPAIFDAYFSTSKDHLKDLEFELLCPFFESHIETADEKRLMNRVNVWIDSSAKERIQWIGKQNVKPFKEPLESLINRVELGLKSDDITQNELATLVNTTFNLGIVIQVSENKEGEQDTNEDIQA